MDLTLCQVSDICCYSTGQLVASGNNLWRSSVMNRFLTTWRLPLKRFCMVQYDTGSDRYLVGNQRLNESSAVPYVSAANVSGCENCHGVPRSTVFPISPPARAATNRPPTQVSHRHLPNTARATTLRSMTASDNSTQTSIRSRSTALRHPVICSRLTSAHATSISFRSC